MTSPPPSQARPRSRSRSRLGERAATSAAILRAHPVWVAVGVGLLAAVLTFARMTPQTAAALWAEDGRDFIADRAASPFGLNWLAPYAGYLHLVPRLVADVTVTWVPIEWWAWSMSVGSCIVVGLVAACAFAITRPLLPGTVGRMLLALVPALTPVAVDQVIGNTANLHTYFLWLVPLLFFALPRRRATSLLLGLVMLAATLTEIQALIFAPLVLWGLRNRSGWPVRAAYVLGMAAQGFSAVFFGREPYSTADTPGPLAAIEGFLANGVGGMVTADRLLVGHTIAQSGWIVFVGVLGLVVLALVAVLAWGSPRQRFFVLVLLYGAVTSFTLGYLLNPLPGLDYATYTPDLWVSTFRFLRYGVPAAMFLLSVVVVAVAVMLDRGRRVVPVVVVALLVVVAVTGFRSSVSERDAGPFWQVEVERAAVSCDGGDATSAVDIPIPPDWAVALECADLP